jgi:aerobic-type carbon monoxide dehydrogenase small subunit (CoxS/CutS family)
VDVQGKAIQTIEGLADGERLHPIQEEFIRHDALQCGFCTPGMIMAVKAILDRNPKASLEEIREGLSGNICRCGTYNRIFEAALAAAKRLQGGA